MGQKVNMGHHYKSAPVVFMDGVLPEVFGVFQVDETLAPFKLTQEQMMLVKSRMRAGLEAGLKNKGSSGVKMLPSFVYRTPDGTGQKLRMKLRTNEIEFSNPELDVSQDVFLCFSQNVESTWPWIWEGQTLEPCW